MPIDGIFQGFGPTSGFEKNGSVKPKITPKKADSGQNPKSLKPADNLPVNNSHNIDAKTNKPGQAQGVKTADMAEQVQKNISRSVAELQAMTDKLQEANQQSQLRSGKIAIDQSLARTKQEFMQVTGERAQFARDVGAEGIGKVSYWEQLELAEKTQTINQLKNRIRTLEADRSDFVEALRDQIKNGVYQVTGREILRGMIEELL